MYIYRAIYGVSSSREISVTALLNHTTRLRVACR